MPSRPKVRNIFEGCVRRNDILQCMLVDDDYLAATESDPPSYFPVLQVLIDRLSGEPQEARHLFLRNCQLYSVRSLAPVKSS